MSYLKLDILKKLILETFDVSKAAEGKRIATTRRGALYMMTE